MTTPISSIKNLGPAFEKSCHAAGILTAEELHEMGADVAYAKLLNAGSRPHLIGYYVLVMALQGRPWNDCKGAEKATLRAKFDYLKAQHTSPARTEFERMMNVIGVRPS